MLSLIIIVVVSLLPFITTWLTSPQDIFIEEERSVRQPREIFRKKTSWKLKARGKVFLGIAVLTIVVAGVQYNENQKATRELQLQLAARDSINRYELRIRDQQSRRELSFRDSLNAEKLRIRDSISNLQLSQRDSVASDRIKKDKNETIVLLSKYNLKYDSAQKRIEELVKDSAKVVEANLPDFNLCSDTGFIVKPLSNYEYILKFRFCDLLAPAKNVNVEFYLLTKDVLGHYEFGGHFTPLPSGTEMSVNAVLTGEGHKLTSLFKLSEVYLLMKGSYTDARGKNLIPISNLASYDLQEKRFGMPSGQTIEIIRRLLSSNGIEY